MVNINRGGESVEPTTTHGSYGAVVERAHCATTTLRRARKRHVCGSCESSVERGSDYLLHKAFPGHDAVTLTSPLTMAECRVCAERCGRGHLFPADADDRSEVRQ